MPPLWSFFCISLFRWAWKRLAGKAHSPASYYFVGKFRWIFSLDSVVINCCFLFLGGIIDASFFTEKKKETCHINKTVLSQTANNILY